ncbi:MAG: glycosyltransferase [Raineya sp.]|nr:glycosyltransferase [Raineya sp.]MDW8296336.1 glycosyltransferase [Raineya sp.]
MKVLFIFGGMPNYLRDFLEKLNQTQNLEVFVVIPEKKSKTIGSGVFEDLQASCSFQILHTQEFLLLGQKPALKNLFQIIKSISPQIVVVGWPYILGLYLNVKLKIWLKKNNIKVFYRSIPYQLPPYQEALQFYTHQGFFDENMNHIKADTLFKKIKYWLITQINRSYFRWVDGHLNYCTQALEILPTYGVPKEKIFVTYNSIDTDKILEAKIAIQNKESILPPNPLRIIHVGRLVKWKKIDMLLEVFARVIQKFPTAELILIGDGIEMQNLQKLAHNLQIHTKVKFLGAIHQTQILGKYFSESLFCVLVGAGGLVINEAMAWGKPVICSEADGTEKDLIIHQKTGLFFEKDNPTDLQAKIEYLLQNPEIAKEMGKNAEEFIFSHINIHTVVKNFVNAFNAVTANQYQLRYEPQTYSYSRSQT